MTLEDINKIDVIKRSSDGSQMTLDIIDSSDHADEKLRYQKLVAKLKTYVAYISSPKFKEEFKDLKYEDITIAIYCKQSPSERMRKIKSIKQKGNEENKIKVKFAKLTA